MKILRSKGIIENGQLSAQVPAELNEGEVDIVIVAEDGENETTDEEKDYEIMRHLAKEKGYDTREKILDLIQNVKLEILQDKGY